MKYFAMLMSLVFLQACSYESGPIVYDSNFSTEYTNAELFYAVRIERYKNSIGVDVNLNFYSPVREAKSLGFSNNVTIAEGESLELIVDGITYSLTPDAGNSLGDGLGLIGGTGGPPQGYVTNVSFEDNLERTIEVRHNRKTEQDIVINFTLPHGFELLEPTQMLETYNPSIGTLFFSWLHYGEDEIHFELRQRNNCFIHTEIFTSDIQQRMITLDTDFHLAPFEPNCNNTGTANEIWVEFEPLQPRMLGNTTTHLDGNVLVYSWFFENQQIAKELAY